MTSFISSVNHNSQDVEEGQLPPDNHQSQVIPFPTNRRTNRHAVGLFTLPTITQPPHHNPHDNSNLDQDSSGQIVLEVVDDQFYSKRTTKKIEKPPQKIKTHTSHRDRERDKQRDKEKGHHDRTQKNRKAQRNEKKGSFAPEREQPNADGAIKNPPYQQPYYPPYMYPPPPVHQMQMGQYPLYHPYSYPMPPYPHYPPQSQNPLAPTQPSPPAQYSQLQSRTGPSQYPEYSDRLEHPFKVPPPPPPPIYNYPGYPMPYPPYDYYERQREAQAREEKQRASRKKEYMDELRNELRRNVQDFNNDESLQILQAVKCILKFQDHRPPTSQSPSSNITEAPPIRNDPIVDCIAQRAYERSLVRVEKWLEGDNANIREFMKGLLEAMQMGDVILKIKELKLTRKMQEESLQSETKRLLDVLVRDPKKMIF